MISGHSLYLSLFELLTMIMVGRQKLLLFFRRTERKLNGGTFFSLHFAVVLYWLPNWWRNPFLLFCFNGDVFSTTKKTPSSSLLTWKLGKHQFVTCMHMYICSSFLQSALFTHLKLEFWFVCLSIIFFLLITFHYQFGMPFYVDWRLWPKKDGWLSAEGHSRREVCEVGI